MLELSIVSAQLFATWNRLKKTMDLANLLKKTMDLANLLKKTMVGDGFECLGWMGMLFSLTLPPQAGKKTPYFLQTVVSIYVVF